MVRYGVFVAALPVTSRRKIAQESPTRYVAKYQNFHSVLYV